MHATIPRSLERFEVCKRGGALSIVAPQGRKYLAADALFRLVRSGFTNSADERDGDAELSFPDALMSACAMVALKSPSLLALDQPRREGNWGTIYGMDQVPCDTSRRERLAPVSPRVAPASFQGVCRPLQRGQALAAMTFLEDHYVVALEGTGYFCAKTLHWAACLQKQPRNGSSTSYPQMWGQRFSIQTSGQ